MDYLIILDIIILFFSIIFLKKEKNYNFINKIKKLSKKINNMAYFNQHLKSIEKIKKAPPILSSLDASFFTNFTDTNITYSELPKYR